MNICDYGCGQEAKFSFKNGKHCCSKTLSQCRAHKKIVSEAIKNAHDQYKRETGLSLFKKDNKLLNSKKQIDLGIKNICFYCGDPAKYQLKNGRFCCAESSNQCPSNKAKNSTSISEMHHQGRGKIFSSDERAKSVQARVEKTISCRLTENSTLPSAQIKNILIEYLQYEKKCDICGVSTWQGAQVLLELHHKNSNRTDNRLENLQLLCPNCHSQTDGFRGAKRNTGTNKVSDEELVTELQKSPNIARALRHLKLTGSGNYGRSHELIDKYNIEHLKKYD